MRFAREPGGRRVFRGQPRAQIGNDGSTVKIMSFKACYLTKLVLPHLDHSKEGLATVEIHVQPTTREDA